MATKVGKSGWAVIVSVAYTGTPGVDALPDFTDDVYYFNAGKVHIKTDGLDRWIPASTFTARYTTDKRSIEVRANDCTISAEEEATSTEELDLIMDFIYNSSIKTGANKVYCWVYHAAEARYKKLSWTSAGVHQRFILGQFKSPEEELTGEEYLWKLRFTFKEATLPA